MGYKVFSHVQWFARVKQCFPTMLCSFFPGFLFHICDTTRAFCKVTAGVQSTSSQKLQASSALHRCRTQAHCSQACCTQLKHTQQRFAAVMVRSDSTSVCTDSDILQLSGTQPGIADSRCARSRNSRVLMPLCCLRCCCKIQKQQSVHASVLLLLLHAVAECYNRQDSAKTRASSQVSDFVAMCCEVPRQGDAFVTALLSAGTSYLRVL